MLQELRQAITDYSDQFGDRRHLTGNQTRTRRMLEESELPVDRFVRAVYVAGARTAARSHRLTGSGSTNPDGTPNVMPYFFGVLKGVLAEVQADGVDGGRTAASGPIRAFARALSKRLSPAVVTDWLAGAEVIEHDRQGRRLVVGVTDELAERKLGVEYQGLVARAAAEALGDVDTVEIVLVAGDEG